MSTYDIERRQHERRSLHGDLRVYLKDPTAFLSHQSFFPAELINISERGLQFKTTHPDVEIGHPVALEVHRIKELPSFAVNARIVSVSSRSIGNEHYTVVSVVFDDVSIHVQEKISIYVEAS